MKILTHIKTLNIRKTYCVQNEKELPVFAVFKLSGLHYEQINLFLSIWLEMDCKNVSCINADRTFSIIQQMTVKI